MDSSQYASELRDTMYSPSLSNKSSQSSMTPSESHDLAYAQHEAATGSQLAHPVIVPPTVSMPSTEQKPKRKRSRVTPAQLVHLEKFFACERSPSAERRKEISELLGMQERQTQIWFQNRRAKAKVAGNVKPEGIPHTGHTPPTYGPEIAARWFELADLVHEDEPILRISCNEISIGTWRRVVTHERSDDLLAYACKGKRRLTWLVRSAGYAFRMDVLFSIIQNVTIQPLSMAATGSDSGLAVASLFLLKPTEDFYLRDVHRIEPTTLQGGGSPQGWKRCLDWTEGRQATEVQKIDVIGSAVHLSGFVQFLRQAASIDVIQHHHQRLPAYVPHVLPTMTQQPLPSSDYAYHALPSGHDNGKIMDRYIYSDVGYGTDTSAGVGGQTTAPYALAPIPPMGHQHQLVGRAHDSEPSFAQPAPIAAPVLPQLTYPLNGQNFFRDENVFTASAINGTSYPIDGLQQRTSPPLLTTPFHPRLDSIDMQTAYGNKDTMHTMAREAHFQQAYVP